MRNSMEQVKDLAAKTTVFIALEGLLIVGGSEIGKIATNKLLVDPAVEDLDCTKSLVQDQTTMVEDTLCQPKTVEQIVGEYAVDNPNICNTFKLSDDGLLTCVQTTKLTSVDTIISDYTKKLDAAEQNAANITELSAFGLSGALLLAISGRALSNKYRRNREKEGQSYGLLGGFLRRLKLVEFEAQ